MSEKLLIINADDYGLTSGVSRGIRYAYQNGIVTSTSAMMNVEGVIADLASAKHEAPTLGIGIHLVLTSGKPVLPSTEVRTLVDHMQQFPKQSVIYDVLPNIAPDQIYREWKAQIEKMLQNGIRPDHLDSHHHIAYRHPMLFEVFLQLAEEYRLPIRCAPEHLSAGISHLSKSSIAQSPDYLETSFYGENISYAALAYILRNLRDGVTELMTHPGEVDSNLYATSSYNVQRSKELALLCSVETRELVKALDISLVTFQSPER